MNVLRNVAVLRNDVARNDAAAARTGVVHAPVRSLVRPVFLLRRDTGTPSDTGKGVGGDLPRCHTTRGMIITITHAYQDAETWLRRRGQGLDSALQAQCMIKRKRERERGGGVVGEGEEESREIRRMLSNEDSSRNETHM